MMVLVAINKPKETTMRYYIAMIFGALGPHGTPIAIEQMVRMCELVDIALGYHDDGDTIFIDQRFDPDC